MTLLRDPHRRSGLSLFEVVLALSIFIGAFTAISQVLRTGSRAAIRAQLNSQAEIYCDRQMNRILAGVEPFQSVSKTTLDDRSDWFWSLNITDEDVPSLKRLEVTVEHDSVNPDAKVSQQLIRLVRDPQFFVDAAIAAEDAAAAAKSSSSSSLGGFQ